MKRFVFRLARVLEIRRTEANIARTRLEQLIRARTETIARVEAAERDHLATFSVPVPQMRLAGDYRQHLGTVIDRLKADAAAAEKRVEEQRRIVIEAERRCELLERLKSKRKAEWEAELARELEELAASAHQARLHAARFDGRSGS
jgi:flagellar export protein FliJ